MKSTKITRTGSLVLLGFFVLYGIFAIPFAFFLLALSAGLIVYGTSESTELAALTVVLGGALIVLISQYKKGPPAKEGFAAGAAEISKRVRSFTPSGTPSGTFSSKGVEGFEDVSAAEKDAPPEPPAGTVDSKPAPAAAATPEPPGLFKLGVLPDETKGGFHIDQGTTVLNALNALHPEQVKKMSDDTQKLIDTQKSLMSMLGTMKPMLTDGKQLMETFQQMFGSGGAAPEKPKV